MFDVITFGSASWDIFLKPGQVKILEDRGEFITGKGICFNLGSKIDIQEMHFSSGGGGTNVAATFANQGFKTAYCGCVGEDLTGKEIIRELKARKIGTGFVATTKEQTTNHSVVLTVIGDDRTILVYRGASEEFSEQDIPWKKLKAKWIYLAPLSGKLCSLFGKLVDFARQNKIKIAANPGNGQLALPAYELRKILEKIDILILNQEEAALLTKTPYSDEAAIFRQIDDLCPGIAVMTKGDKGAIVSDGKNVYSASSPKVQVADKTGAGDAFGAGFVSGYIRSRGNIDEALKLGIANSAACVQEFGAKNGLLKK